MEELENEVISMLDVVAHFYKRDVDNSILCIPYSKLEYTQKVFNYFHHRLQFTVEKEQENSINFIEINLK